MPAALNTFQLLQWLPQTVAKGLEVDVSAKMLYKVFNGA